jgi:hypothetical protein
MDGGSSQECEAVPAAHAFDVDAVDSGGPGCPTPAGADQSNLMTACRQPGEDFEQVYLSSAGMRIREVLPVDEKDIHAEESKNGPCVALRAKLQPPKRMSDPIEHPIDEAGGASASEPVSQSDGLVDGDLGRNITPAQLMDAEPQDVPLHRSYAAHTPVLGGVSKLSIQHRQLGNHLCGQLLRPVENSWLGARQPGYATHYHRDRPSARELPGI